MKPIKRVEEEAGMGTGIIGDGSAEGGVLGDGDNTIPSRVGKTQKRKELEDEDDKK
jgi:hypothetical protein